MPATCASCGLPDVVCRAYRCSRCGCDCTLWESPICPTCEATVHQAEADVRLIESGAA